MATKRPSLVTKPTLADIQKYIGDMNHFRGHNADTQYCLLLLCEEVGELAKAVRKSVGGTMDVDRPDAHADEEAADVLWMLLSICNGLGIDLEQALRAKEEKNKLRTWK